MVNAVSATITNSLAYRFIHFYIQLEDSMRLLPNIFIKRIWSEQEKEYLLNLFFFGPVSQSIFTVIKFKREKATYSKFD